MTDYSFRSTAWMVENTTMAMNLADEPDPAPSPQSVRSVFRKETSWSHRIGTVYEQVTSQKALLAGLAALAVLLLLIIGFALGGGFTTSPEAATAATGDYFITVEQADELRAQATELQEAKSQLAIVEGEAAYLVSQTESLTGDLEALQSSFNATQVEMSIIVGIFEECMARLYPAECVAAARPRAEAFLAELFAATP
jgi:hypothetical protein